MSFGSKSPTLIWNLDDKNSHSEYFEVFHDNDMSLSKTGTLELNRCVLIHVNVVVLWLWHKMWLPQGSPASNAVMSEVEHFNNKKL